MASRASEIEKAATELRRVLGEEPLRRYTAECMSRLGIALALPEDPPGECCRRTAEAMREAAFRELLPNWEYAAKRIQALPLPGAKEGDR